MPVTAGFPSHRSSGKQHNRILVLEGHLDMTSAIFSLFVNHPVTFLTCQLNPFCGSFVHPTLCVCGDVCYLSMLFGMSGKTMIMTTSLALAFILSVLSSGLNQKKSSNQFYCDSVLSLNRPEVGRPFCR